jgi:hypothetical protein
VQSKLHSLHSDGAQLCDILSGPQSPPRASQCSQRHAHRCASWHCPPCEMADESLVANKVAHAVCTLNFCLCQLVRTTAAGPRGSICPVTPTILCYVALCACLDVQNTPCGKVSDTKVFARCAKVCVILSAQQPQCGVFLSA